MAENTFIPTSVSGNLSTPQVDTVALRQSVNSLALALNYRESGSYPVTPTLCGKIFFPNVALNSATAKAPVGRPAFRQVYNFGVLPNGAPTTKTMAHGINFDVNTTISFIEVYGIATDQVHAKALRLPYASPTDADNIELYVDGPNIVVTTGGDRSSFNVCYIVLEWLIN